MATSMNISTDRASEMSMRLVGLAGDISSFKNVGIDQVTTALNGIFSGETESLKTLGIVMTQANLEQFALSQGIKKHVQDMTQAEQVQLRYNYVLSVTKNAQGDYKNTLQGTANQMRLFKESIKETGAGLGQVLLPYVTSALLKINEMIKAFKNFSEEGKKRLVIFATITAVIPPLMIALGSLINSFKIIGAVVGGISAPVLAVVGVLVAFGVAYKTNFLGIADITNSAVKKVSDYIKGLVPEFKKLYNSILPDLKNIGTTIKTTVLDIVNVIKPVIVNFANFIREHKTEITEGIKIALQVMGTVWRVQGAIIVTTIQGVIKFLSGFIGMWNSVIKTITSLINGDWKLAWENFKNIFMNMFKMVSGLLLGFSSIFRGTFTGIKTIITTVFVSMVNAISTYCQNIVNTVISRFNSITNYISTLPARFYTYGVQMFSNMANGITNSIGNIRNMINSGLNNALSDISSISSKAYSWGSDLLENFKNGLMSKFPNLTGAVQTIAQYIKDHLGHTVPKEGVLSDDDKWMGHFMDNLTSGIDSNKYKVLNSVKNLTSGMSMNLKSLGVEQNVIHTVKEHGFSATNNKTIQVFVPVNLDGKQITNVLSPKLDIKSGTVYQLNLRGAGIR